MTRPEVSGGMTVRTRMELDSIEGLHPRGAAGAMPGRVTGLLRDRFSARQVVLLRGLPARITVREEAFVAIVVVGVGVVGGFADRPRPGQLIPRRLQRRMVILLPSPSRWR